MAVESTLGSQLTALSTEVREVKTDIDKLKQTQANQAEQVQVLGGMAVQQAFAFNSDKKLSFFNGARKQSLIISGNGLNGKEAVVQALQQALVKSGVNCTTVQLEQQLFGFRELPGGKAPNKRTFFKVRNVHEAEQIWSAKKHLGAQVYMSVDLSPVERDNKAKLLKNAAFKVAKQTAVDKKLQHGWILDEYYIVWEQEGRKQKVHYHAKYPLGLLSNGDDAPPNSQVAAAAAAGMC